MSTSYIFLESHRPPPWTPRSALLPRDPLDNRLSVKGKTFETVRGTIRRTAALEGSQRIKVSIVT